MYIQRSEKKYSNVGGLRCEKYIKNVLMLIIIILKINFKFLFYFCISNSDNSEKENIYI